MERRIVIAMYDGIQPLDVVGPHEVFSLANRVLDRVGSDTARYRIETVAERPGPVRAESGLVLHAERPLPGDARIDTVIVPGGDGSRDTEARAELIAWLADAPARCRRVATVCSGTLVAAAAGLCDGRRVTTHWVAASLLAERHPDVEVDPDPIYVRDGDLWTSAGVTAGIDLCLALVREDCGATVAQWVARTLVVPLQRAGGQTQFSPGVWSEPGSSDPIRSACDRIQADPAADHGLDRLAGSVGLSPRHFTRRFRAEVGQTPARYVEAVRVDAARRLLELDHAGLDEVVRRCGFGTAETLRRAFHRRLGMSPDHYRRSHAVV